MHISAYILPRRVILTLLILLGLFLRLWGLSWPAEAFGFYPEWGTRVIDNISWFKLVYREEIWTQALYSIAFLLKYSLSGIAGIIEVWLGLARASSEVTLESLLAGRLAVALLGTAQIWLVYQVGRRWFNSVGTGLMAAAWLAVSPLLVMESHYLATGVPLGFMTLVCLWAALNLQNHGKPWNFIIAGLSLGLCITFKASGILVAPLILWAACLAWHTHKPSLHMLVLLVFCALFGLWLGLTLGSPGFVLQLFRMHTNVWESFTLPPLFGGAALPYVTARFEEMRALLQNWIGWHWVVLWGAGLIILLKKRSVRRMAIALFPILYLPAAIFILTSPMENLLAAALPHFILLAVWPLVLLCRRIPGRLLPAWSLAVAGLLLLAFPLLSSYRLGYLFWQQPALNAAVEWADNNLPQPGQAGSNRTDNDYILLPAGTKEANGLQIIKSFDLINDWAPEWFTPTFSLAQPYHIYANQPAISPKEPLSYARLPVAADASSRLVFADHNYYSHDEGSIFIARPGIANRLLRLTGKSEHPLLYVKMRNQGNTMAVLRLNQGLLSVSRLFTLYPGQEADVLLRAKAWPLLMGGTYPLSARLYQGENLWINWQWNPLNISYNKLLANESESVSGLLAGNSAFEARIMRLNALSKTGQWDEARALLNAIDPKAPALTLAQEPDNDAWFIKMADYAGLNPKLLEDATGIVRLVAPVLSSSPAMDQVQVEGSGFSGVLERQLQSREGWLKLTLNDVLPMGFWRLHLYLNEPASRPMAIQLWSVAHDNEFLLEQAGFSVGEESLSIPFRQRNNADRTEIRIELAPGGAGLKSFALKADLHAHIQQIHNWYQEAACLVYLHDGQFTRAIEAIGSITFALSDEQMLLEAKALWGAGKHNDAMPVMEKLRANWNSYPEGLSWLKDLYQKAGELSSVQAINYRLAELRPSISKNAAFSNGLTLLGYDGPLDSELNPGNILNFNLYWLAHKAPIVDAAIYLKLRGPGINRDYSHRLNNGADSMTRLSSGRVVREAASVQLPRTMAPGIYQLWLGLVDEDHTGRPLTVTEGEFKGNNELLLLTIEIK